METNFVRCAACDALGRNVKHLYAARAYFVIQLFF